MPDELSPQQPVFYSLTPKPEPAPIPFYKKRQFAVVAGAVVVGMLIAGFVIAFAVNMIRSASQEKAAIADKASTVEQMVENGTPQGAAAREAQFADGCKGLEGEAYASCVSLIAADAKNEKICDALSGDEKTACVDAAILLRAKAGKDYKACDAITDDILKSSCQASLQASAATAGDCAGYGVPAEFCDAQRALTAAVASGNPASCDALSESERAGCRDIFTSTDNDHDGLTLAQEYEHGTSDQNADSDGDGYTDGEEVASGHDPLKK